MFIGGVCKLASIAPRHRTHALLMLTFLVLPPSSTAVLRTFKCEEFDDGTSYLVTDYTLSCDSAKHDGYVLFASVALLVYPIGIPILYAKLLHDAKDSIRPRAETMVAAMRARSGDKSLAPIAFLFKYYSPDHWYWEVGDSVRRVLMTGGLVFCGDDPALRACVGFGFALLSLLCFREASPYIGAPVNTLANAAQWQLVIVFFSGILITGTICIRDAIPRP